MRTIRNTQTCIEMVHESGKVETITVSNQLLAGLKRSIKWKRKITYKKLFVITTIIKIP